MSVEQAEEWELVDSLTRFLAEISKTTRLPVFGMVWDASRSDSAFFLTSEGEEMEPLEYRKNTYTRLLIDMVSLYLWDHEVPPFKREWRDGNLSQITGLPEKENSPCD